LGAEKASYMLAEDRLEEGRQIEPPPPKKKTRRKKNNNNKIKKIKKIT